MIHDLENEPKKQGFRAYFTVGVVSFLVIAAAVVFFFLLFRMKTIRLFLGRLTSILQPIIIGFVIAYLLSPIMGFFEQKLTQFALSTGKKETISSRMASTIRGTSIFLSLLIVGILFYILGSLIIPELYVTITSIIKDTPGHIDSFTSWINTTLDNNQLIASYAKQAIVKITDFFENWVETDLLSQINTWVNYFASGLLGVINVFKNLLVGIIVSIYVLLEKDHFAAQGKMILYALLNTDVANVTIKTLRQSNQIFGGFIIGKIIDSLIIGVLCFIGLSFLKMPYTLLVSVIVGVTNVIPYFGPFFGAIPSAILILFVDPAKCIYFLIFILVLQQLDGNIIGPTILGDSTGLSAFWVIFSILTAGGLFGFIGMLIGVPAFAVIYYIVSTYIEYRLSCKKLKDTSKDYEQLDYIDVNSKKSVYR